MTASPAAEPTHARKPRRRDAALAKWRQAKAVELAQAGHDYDSIAKDVGYSNRGTAWRVVQDALKARVVEGVDDLRELEVERLEGLHRAHWHQALEGNLKSAEVILRAMEQRIRLLGLDQGPVADRQRTEPVSIIQPAV